MILKEVEVKLFESYYLNNPISNWDKKDSLPGYYAIWIKNPESILEQFKTELIKRKSNLLYIGIAETSLFVRLFEQELMHQKTATFFRAIGALIGYRPSTGSLSGKKNQNNYKFCNEDTKSICEWIDINIAVSFIGIKAVNLEIEKELIKKHIPILNWTHNQNKFQPLKLLRKECREIAKQL